MICRCVISCARTLNGHRATLKPSSSTAESAILLRVSDKMPGKNASHACCFRHGAETGFRRHAIVSSYIALEKSSRPRGRVRPHARRVCYQARDRKSLCAFFECCGFALQMGKNFAGEMKRPGDQDRIWFCARVHQSVING